MDSRADIPAIEMPADYDDFFRFLGATNLADDVMRFNVR
jgi:hypothetical protein